MCMCGKPTINGEPGYSWDGLHFGVRHPDPPLIFEADDSLLFDEPGRCGGVDAHCHHFRVVLNGSRPSRLYLLVRHGGGEERINLCVYNSYLMESFRRLDSNGRYWVLHSVYCVQRDAAQAAQENERERWAKAAAEKRIKVRKRSGMRKVEIVSA